MKSFWSYIIVSSLSFTAGYLLAVQGQSSPIANLSNVNLQSTESKPHKIKPAPYRQSPIIESGAAVLSSNLERMALPIPVSTSISDLTSRVDTLPTSLITSQLRHLFDDEFISNIDSPHSFAKTLLEIALDIEPVENENTNVSIEFSLSPVYGTRPLNIDASINQYQAVFAHIISDQESKNILIKWQNITTGEILFLRETDLSNDRQSNGILLAPSDGWQQASYQLAAYHVADTKILLANARLHINHIYTDDDTTGRDTIRDDIILDLLSSGRASPKTQ